MAGTILVSTRKGLFVIERRAAGSWEIARVGFLGDAVTLSLYEPRERAVYAGMGLGHFGVKLRKSTDLGRSWEDVAAPAFPPEPEGHAETFEDGKPWPWQVQQIWSLEAGAGEGQLWCGTLGGGLFRSDDAGLSWSLVSGLWEHPARRRWFGGGADWPGIHSICVHPDDGERLLVAVSCGGVLRSADAGLTWEGSSRGMFAAYMPPERREDESIQDPHRVVQCRTRPERLWCQHHNGVFRSDDGARTWHEVPNVAPSVFGFAVAVDPNDGDTAWLVPAIKDETRVPVDAKVVVSRTRDGGQSWEVLREGLPQSHAYDLTLRHALDVDETGRRLAFGSSTGSLWISEDAGERWQCLSAHLPPIYAVRFAQS